MGIHNKQINVLAFLCGSLLMTLAACQQAEEKKREEDEHRKQENELAFKAWLLRKREQLQEEKRIHRAQEMERSNCKVRPPGGDFP